MTARENVLAVLNHQNTGRVPISIGCTQVDTFTLTAKDDYERFLGFDISEHIILEKPYGTAVLSEKLLAYCENDFRPVRMGPLPGFEIVENEDGTYIDEWGSLLKPSVHYYDPVKWPLSGDISVKDIENYPWADFANPSRIEGMKEQAVAIRERGFAVCFDVSGISIFDICFWIRGCDQILIDLYHDPVIAEALFSKLTELNIMIFNLVLSEIGDYVDVVCIADDLGTQAAPFISPEMYKKFLKPNHRKTNDVIKSKTKAKIFLHSCGSVYYLIPNLIEAGFDILNPIQTSAKNMEPERLKREFGNDLAFWGGLDVQKILPFGTPQEISDETKRLMDVMGKGGGYVFSPAHNIQAGVPVENIDCMIKSAIKYRDLR